MTAQFSKREFSQAVLERSALMTLTKRSWRNPDTSLRRDRLPQTRPLPESRKGRGSRPSPPRREPVERRTLEQSDRDSG